MDRAPRSLSGSAAHDRPHGFILARGEVVPNRPFGRYPTC